MKVTFLGGGSYRTLPAVRSALAQQGMMAGGEIALFDLNASRAEMVGRMIMRTPEFAHADCKVTWDQPVEQALEGANEVNIGFPCGSPIANWRSDYVSRKHGFMSSDQLSPTGAFLSLYGGPIVLNYARMMEQYCPQAWFVIFANPVAVYSALVNNHTKIRALGVCAGYSNHQWDLMRLMGQETFGEDIDVDVAGVNHLSFMLRGTIGNEEMYAKLERYIGEGWRPPTIAPPWVWLEKHIHRALSQMIDMYRKFGVMIFSTEGDGLAHLYYDESFHPLQEGEQEPTLAEMEARMQQGRAKRDQADAEFRAHLDRELTGAFWQEQSTLGTHFGRDDHGVTLKILRAIAGVSTEKIATSFPNRGGVVGFDDRTVLEYSQYLDQDGIRPAASLAVPMPFQGLISALATHQTLLADAIATEDPRTLYQALYAYPIKQNTRASRALYRDLLNVHAAEMPAAFQQTAEYLAD